MDKGDGARLLPVTGPEPVAQTETQEVPSEHKETLLHYNSDQEPALVS